MSPHLSSAISNLKSAISPFRPRPLPSGTGLPRLACGIEGLRAGTCVLVLSRARDIIPPQRAMPFKRYLGEIQRNLAAGIASEHTPPTRPREEFSLVHLCLLAQPGCNKLRFLVICEPSQYPYDKS